MVRKKFFQLKAKRKVKPSLPSHDFPLLSLKITKNQEPIMVRTKFFSVKKTG